LTGWQNDLEKVENEVILTLFLPMRQGIFGLKLRARTLVAPII
jgi:hypothetical protein